MGKEAQRYRFDDVLAVLNNVIGLEKMPKDKISVKTQAMLNIYLFEKQKAEAVSDFEKAKD